MTNEQLQYYFDMEKMGRMFHYKKDSRLVCIITYFIGNGNPDKYVDRYAWSVIKDDPNGNTLYIDQLLTDKNRDNSYLSLEIWHNLKQFIRNTYPNIKHIRHNRYKKNWQEPKTFRREL